MDIAILNYTTGEVDILRNVDPDFVDAFYGDVETYLEEEGYNTNDIHYMCAKELIVNDNRCS